jgi:hypothetical protein
MIKIDYPSYQPKIKTSDGKEFIFDELRKQWALLTPEEWVRQNFLQYLVQVKKYPSSLIAVEKEIFLNGLKKRFDMVVYNRAIQPWMVVECKEMNVALTQTVLDQVIRYNMVLQSYFLVITNGLHCFAFAIADGQMTELKELPEY